MATDTGAGLVPAGYSAVDPWVISRDTSAEIEFLSRVFGARERPGSRMLNPDGTIGHVEVELSGSVLMMFDAQPGWPLWPAQLRVYVDDAPAAFDRALAAGAAAVTRVTELFFGERVCRVRDRQAHLWWIHERTETLDPAELGRRLADPAFRAAMAYVQESGAAELGRETWSAPIAVADIHGRGRKAAVAALASGAHEYAGRRSVPETGVTALPIPPACCRRRIRAVEGPA